MFQKRGKPYIESHWNNIDHHQKRSDKHEGGIGVDIYRFKLKMANTLSVMTNVLRNVVSKQRIRYKEKGFNLDLAYICDNIIAMGYPADNIESMYRNRIEDVYKFLEENHHDHYKIYNLCLERSYDINKFHGRVAVYPFEDHNPPTIELIQTFCDDVDSWLKGAILNVAAVHCKAGKGRTGTMICCYLLYSGQQSTAEDALACYDEKRTKDRKGVTIPSQRRYVQYFSKLIRSGSTYEKRTLQFCEIRFTEANNLQSQGTVHCSISVLKDSTSAVKVQLLQNLTIDFRKSFTLDMKNPTLSVAGDIRVELTHKKPRNKIFHFWFNTFFVCDEAVVEGEGDNAKYVYTLNKCEIDDAHKDKEHKCFSEDFKVHLVFYVESFTGCNQIDATNQIGNQRSSQSSQLIQSQYTFPQNNSSRSNLNYVCDQKSSSSAFVSSSGGTGSESRGLEAGMGKCFTSIYSECDTKPVKTAPQLPLSLPPSNEHFNDKSSDHHVESNNISKQQQHFVKGADTETSTPNLKHTHITAHVSYNNDLNQLQQQYQPSANVPRVRSRDTHNNIFTNSSGINSNTNIGTQCGSLAHIASNNSSKSSSISSHSSSSVTTADNEEDWESGESHAHAKPLATSILLFPLMPTPPLATTYSSSLIPASNLNTSFYLNSPSDSSSSSKGKQKLGGVDYNDDDDKIVNFKSKWPELAKPLDMLDEQEGSGSTGTDVDTALQANQQQPQQSLVLSANTVTTPTTSVKLMHLLLAPKANEIAPKQPFFKRKSFKSNLATDTLTTPGYSSISSVGSNCSGLTTSSKQKLKIKLKKNKLKLSQKFQWFQSYFRTDPVDFCENFVQQTTAMRRNSTSSISSRSHKLSASTPTLPSSILPKYSCSPPSCYIDKVDLISKSKPQSSASNDSITAISDFCEDYYSSICDNQLSFNNSPCKSPRSLDTVMIGSIGSHTLQRLRSGEYGNQQSLTQIPIQPAVNSRHNIVVVSAKPPKTQAIGFNVAVSTNFPCTYEVHKNDVANTVISTSSSSALKTGAQSLDIAASPFVFPSMREEIKKCQLSASVEGMQKKKQKCERRTVLNLLILKEHEESEAIVGSKTKSDSTQKEVDNNQDDSDKVESEFKNNSPLNCNTTTTPDSNGIVGGATITSVCSNSSSSGFCTSECCTNSSNSNCSCNPFALDLERHAKQKATFTSSVKEKAEPPQDGQNLSLQLTIGAQRAETAYSKDCCGEH